MRVEVCRFVTGSAATLGNTQSVMAGTLGASVSPVSPATKVVCTGDALKSCTLSKDNHATIDVQSAGPGQSQPCSCWLKSYK